MNDSFDFWRFFAGIGLFLWGMYQLEHALKQLAGKSFKILLQKFTHKPWKGILVGTLITAILQSSSLVSLMVLAFLGAKIITLRSAIGVILGANLGTTFTAWIVAAFGFKLSVSDFALPFFAIGSVLFLFFKKRPTIHNLGWFAIGFALLFLGLDFMKTAIEAVADQINLQEFSKYGLWVFLLLGIVITALIQSSSAMTVIVLSALSAGIVNMYESVALVLGANIGTTITVGIGAIGGEADKKRLALANLFFKTGAGLLIFPFIVWIVDFLDEIISISDPLMELVLLNTFVNLFGIIIFYPFLIKIEAILEKQFLNADNDTVTSFIKNITYDVPEVAVEALEKEIQLTFTKLEHFMQSALRLNNPPSNQKNFIKQLLAQPTDRMENYQNLKKIEEELTSFHIKIMQQTVSEKDTKRMTSLMLSLRTIMYSAKYIKDVLHNISELKQSDHPLSKTIFSALQQWVTDSLAKIDRYKSLEIDARLIPLWMEQNNQKYQELITMVYEALKTQTSDVSVSNMTNLIKQINASLNSYQNGLFHWKLLKDEVIE